MIIHHIYYEKKLYIIKSVKFQYNTQLYNIWKCMWISVVMYYAWKKYKLHYCATYFRPVAFKPFLAKKWTISEIKTQETMPLYCVCRSHCRRRPNSAVRQLLLVRSEDIDFFSSFEHNCLFISSLECIKIQIYAHFLHGLTVSCRSVFKNMILWP